MGKELKPKALNGGSVFTASAPPVAYPGEGPSPPPPLISGSGSGTDPLLSFVVIKFKFLGLDEIYTSLLLLEELDLSSLSFVY